jgi:hypothetical protein
MARAAQSLGYNLYFKGAQRIDKLSIAAGSVYPALYNVKKMVAIELR